MYEKHFSFKHKPFELIPNPDFLFLSNTHKKAITYIDYGIKEKIGFILLTGEIGSGKTTIVRNLIKNLNGSVRLSRVNNTKVSSEQLIAMINDDFGLDVEGKSKTKLLSDLNEFLINQYSDKFQPILLIDEAQNLSPDLLEEIRMLSNLETDRAKLLQIILVGQPELKKTLMMPELMQLRQRININYHIAPLTIDETERYIKHRLSIAGNPDAIEFEDTMVSRIYQFSRGIPRLINILCDFALLAAYVDARKTVNIEIIQEVIKDLESRDYWSESLERSNDREWNEEYAELKEAASNVALRLIKLEETLRGSLPDMDTLLKKIKRLEEKVDQLNEDGEINRVSDLLDRLEEKLVCRILVRVSEENEVPDVLDRLSRLETMLGEVTVNKQNDFLSIETEREIHQKVEKFVERLDELTKKINWIEENRENR
jgi:general secretion pathway protein A